MHSTQPDTHTHTHSIEPGTQTLHTSKHTPLHIFFYLFFIDIIYFIHVIEHRQTHWLWTCDDYTYTDTHTTHRQT